MTDATRSGAAPATNPFLPALPAGTRRCTPDERRAALRRRHEASKRRWGL